MKFLNYELDPRWDICDDKHKAYGYAPSWIIAVLLKYKDILYLDDVDVAIETGTHNASTSMFLAEVFLSVKTVEKYPENNPYGGNFTPLHNTIALNYPNIEFFYMDSSVFLEKILPYQDKRCFIYLDAHSITSSPLRSELEAIRLSTRVKNHIILIDDGVDLELYGFTEKTLYDFVRTINENYKMIVTGTHRKMILIYE